MPGDRKWVLFAGLMAVGFILWSVLWRGGGWLHGEADTFLVDHLSDRPLWSRMVCPHLSDCKQYQARELSFVLEQVDSWFIYFCCTRGVPHFYSLLTAVFMFLVSLANFRFATRWLGLDRWAALLLSALFWTSPCIFFGGFYVRTAKQGAAFVLFFLVWYLYRHLIHAPGKVRWRLGLESFLLTLALCFLDRQGYYMAVALGLTLALTNCFLDLPGCKTALFAVFAAAAAHTIYNLFLGPIVVRAATGYSVSFEYQKLSWNEFSSHWFAYSWHGLWLLLDTIGDFLGNSTATLAACACLLAMRLFATSNAGGTSKSCLGFRLSPARLMAVALALGLILLVLMNILMVVRHYPIIQPDVRRIGYYWVPTTVLVLVGATFVLYWLGRRRWLPVLWTRLGLAALVASNLFSLSEVNRIWHQGSEGGYMVASPYVLTAIRELYRIPPGVPGSVPDYDESKNFTALAVDETLRNPLHEINTTRHLDAAAFVKSSHFYNFLRSKRNLDFTQAP